MVQDEPLDLFIFYVNQFSDTLIDIDRGLISQFMF
jgi:hypothetical protein